jgi:hypothetical protein
MSTATLTLDVEKAQHLGMKVLGDSHQLPDRSADGGRATGSGSSTPSRPGH